MSTEVKSKDWCPICLLQNKAQNVLMNRPGKFATSCSAGHEFMDTEELNTMRAQARAKFPALYASEAPKVDTNALANQDIVINAEVKKAIEEIVSQNITSGSDLKGLLYAYVQDNKDKENEVRSLRATIATMGKRAHAAPAGGTGAALSAGQFIVTAPEWALEGLQGQADYQGKSAEEWVAENFTEWCENYFGSTVQR
jgi:hypothetical protein